MVVDDHHLLLQNDSSTPAKHCPVFLWTTDETAQNQPFGTESDAKKPMNAIDLLSLVKSTKTPPIRITFTPSLTSKTAGQGAVQLQFWPNRDLLGQALENGPSSSAIQRTVCHFETTNPVTDEHSALSVCNNPKDINGLLRLNGRTFALGVNASTDQFYLVPEGHGQSCGWPTVSSRRRTKRSEGAGSEGPAGVPEYYPEYTDGKRRHVELIFIADNTVYKKYENDEQRVHDRLQSIASAVNSLYAPLNIRVTLVWADIWRNADPIEVTEEADKTLRDFLGYRKTLLADHPHDNAQLLTDVHFGSVIGKAYKGTMCSFEFSGGVIVDHAELPAFVGLTVAHEMGHNFGMDHDAGYPDPCKCAVQQCIMAPASSNVNATSFFSDCSLDTLSSAFRRGVDYCLHNVPKSAFGGAKCGNGILEEGEQCDCGSTESCPNRCCVAAECKLAKDAECAEGECCDMDLCKPRPRATTCRSQTNDCDLPEFCDGKNPICPPDFFVQDGHECPEEPNDFCYEGVCGSRERQCQFIWGPTAKSSIYDCYAYNQYGSFSGNCGYNQTNEQYLRCNANDVTCGRLQCQHESDRPVFGDPSTVYAAYNLIRDRAGKDAICRVVRTTMTGVGKQRAADPGMVPNGARCVKQGGGVSSKSTGAHQDSGICVDAKCRNSTEVLQMVSKCQPENCNGKGVCNNVGNCHCIAGYGGIACDLPGPGGSVNSGPANGKVFNPGLALLYLLFVVFIMFFMATIYCKRKRGFWLHKKIWSKARVALDLRSFNLRPTRKAPPPPGSTIQHTHRQSWNAVWGDPPASATATEVLHVDASRPYLMGGARAVLKMAANNNGSRSHNHNQPVIMPMGHVQYFAASPTHAPMPPAKSKKATREAERRALVVPQGYDTGGSTSSEEHDPRRAWDRQQQKQGINADQKIGADQQQQQCPPPPPPHRGQKQQGQGRRTEETNKPKAPKLPTKPPIDLDNKMDGGTDDGNSAKLNVKALAAKFDKK